MKESCLKSFEMWVLILSWQASLRESTLTGLCCANFMAKNHVRIEVLDCEVWKKYKDDRGIVWLWDAGSCLTPDGGPLAAKGDLWPQHPILCFSLVPPLHPSHSPAKCGGKEPTTPSPKLNLGWNLTTEILHEGTTQSFIFTTNKGEDLYMSPDTPFRWRQ